MVYYNLEILPREAGGPLEKYQVWFAANADGPMRKLVADRCGVGRASVGKYINDKREGAVY